MHKTKSAFFGVVAVCALVSGTASADSWDNGGASFGLPATDAISIDIGAGGTVDYGKGDWGTQTLGDAALVFRFGVAVCMGGETGVGLVGGANGIYNDRGYGTLEMALSVCRRMGADVVEHTYAGGSVSSLRLANAQTEVYGGRIGEVAVIAHDPGGLRKTTVDASAIVGVLQNVYYVPGRESDPQASELAVGARFSVIYRDLVHRLELAGAFNYTGAVQQPRDLEVDGSASVRWLAVRLGQSNAYMYVGVQGNVLYAQNLVKSVDALLGHIEQTKSQTGVQGLGTLGVSFQ